MNVLYESWNETTRRSTTIELDAETGLPVIVHAQDTKPIIDANKRQAASFDKHTARRQDFVHVARIPMVIWQRLNRLGITKDPVAFNQWLDSREGRFLRTDDARRL